MSLFSLNQAACINCKTSLKLNVPSNKFATMLASKLFEVGKFPNLTLEVLEVEATCWRRIDSARLRLAARCSEQPFPAIDPDVAADAVAAAVKARGGLSESASCAKAQIYFGDTFTAWHPWLVQEPGFMSQTRSSLCHWKALHGISAFLKIICKSTIN